MSNNNDPPEVKLPQSHNDLKPSQGFYQGRQLYTWDALADCVHEQCPIFTLCYYNKKGKCKVQQRYLSAVQTSILSNYPDMSESALFKVGMQLIPLYKMLCRLKMIELGVANLEEESQRGSTNIHPVLREIRETLKSIALMWKMIGLDDNWSSRPGPKTRPPDPSLTTENLHGDPSAHDRMMGLDT